MFNSGYPYQAFERDSEHLYNHWLDIKKGESPADLLTRFADLFIEGIGYRDIEVLQARNRILNSQWAEQNFKHILNRCCYILINHWWSQSEVRADLQQATHRLVALFKTEPYLFSTTPEIDRLRVLVKAFTQTQQYAMLEQRVRLAGRQTSSNQAGQDAQTQPISELIHRYPLLYPHYLRDDDSSDGRRYAIGQLQAQREKQFEQDLSRYITSQVRHSSSGSAVKNPTLLSNQQLTDTVRQFVGKTKGVPNYQDSARQFLTSAGQIRSHYEVKQQMHAYLTAAINPDYGEHHFNEWLSEQLRNALLHSDRRRPSGALLVQTCGHLLDSLLAYPLHCNSSNHLVFLDLNNNLGSAFTIGLLLRIVLLCRGVKANLDAIKARVAKHFAEMFKYYETQTQGQVAWLTECLDNLMVAYAIHFGQGGVSRWESLL